jgi:hypothetical protein
MFFSNCVTACGSTNVMTPELMELICPMEPVPLRNSEEAAEAVADVMAPFTSAEAERMKLSRSVVAARRSSFVI